MVSQRLSPKNDTRHGTEAHRYTGQPMTFNCGKVLKALSDTKRQRIVKALLTEPQSVNDLGASLNMEQYNVSKGLNILRVAGIVEYKQVGSVRIYRIVRAALVGNENEKNVLEFGCCQIRFDRIFD
jgi:DNA-binding transcriptional ArsR family regulator